MAGNKTGIRSYVINPIESTSQHIMTAISYSIAILAAASNTLVIYLMLTAKKPRVLKAFYRSHASLFTLSLSLSDVLTGMISIPLQNAARIMNIHSSIVCQTHGILILLFPAITVLNLMVISIEKYLAIFYPFYLPSTRAVRGLIASMWLLGVAITTCYNINTRNVFSFIVNEDSFTLVCAPDDSLPTYNATVCAFVMLMFLLPVVAQIFFALKIRAHLKQRIRWRHALTLNQFVWLSVFAFIVPCLPWVLYIVVNISVQLKLSFEQDALARHGIFLCLLSNSLINPVMYFFFYSTKQFRQRSQIVLRRLLCYVRAHRCTVGICVTRGNRCAVAYKAAAAGGGVVDAAINIWCAIVSDGGGGAIDGGGGAIDGGGGAIDGGGGAIDGGGGAIDGGGGAIDGGGRAIDGGVVVMVLLVMMMTPFLVVVMLLMMAQFLVVVVLLVLELLVVVMGVVVLLAIIIMVIVVMAKVLLLVALVLVVAILLEIKC
ncbi:predicted protein [Nematostella vectensis]|uniref:G-protein coupled receptors family 1 profile domain-containing protein n=1 Tax=Nematostella vectensis TaxID=45351 RepID=A7RYJ0_NEMVE|nr:predicted protein [Nematostella vectensis]|eukprot:XP_001635593.1 predicted protein [Nematostella vectensis]